MKKIFRQSHNELDKKFIYETIINNEVIDYLRKGIRENTF